MMEWSNDLTTLLLAAFAAFVLAAVSAVAGFGGGLILLPVFTALFGIRVAIPVLTLAQFVSNGSRVAFNRQHLHWPLIGWFSAGAVPTAVAFGLLFAAAPLGGLARLLGVFLLGMVAWKRLRPSPPHISERGFLGVGAASGAGSALVGSVGPLTAPFFLAYGLVKDAYIGTEAASAVVMHAAKLLAYGAGDLIDGRVLILGAALTPSTMLGAWIGKRVVDRLSERVFVALVEAGLVVSGFALILSP